MTIRTLLLASLFSAAATAALAHHGWAGQEEKVTELTGTVTKGVSLAGPHAEMQIRVGNDLWDVTLAPPPRTSAAGLRPGMIPIGDTVTLRGTTSTEPGHREMKTILVVPGARRYAVYPDRQ